MADTTDFDTTDTNTNKDQRNRSLRNAGVAGLARLCTLDKADRNGPVGLLQQLALHARREAGINLPFSATTPYQNTIPSRQQPPFPGSQEMERRIKSLVRWNAMAMVVRANKIQEGIGGHISTFASAATLYEVAFNHFFQAATESGDRDIVYFQGHAAPRNLRPRLSRGPDPQRETGKLPAGNETGRRTLVLSASLAHARLLGISYRVHGTRARFRRSIMRASSSISKIAD